MDDDDADDDVVGADDAYDLDDVGERNLATTVVADQASTVTATSRTTPKQASTKAFRRALGSGRQSAGRCGPSPAGGAIGSLDAPSGRSAPAGT